VSAEGAVPAGDLPAGAGDLPAGAGDLPAGAGDLPAGAGDLPVLVDGLVRRAAGLAPDKAALVSPAGALTWAQLEAAVEATAAGLLALGLQAGDRVAVQLANTLDFPTVYFGVLRAGLVVVPVNPDSTAREVEHLVGDSGARVLVSVSTRAAAASSVQGALPCLEHVVLVGGDDEGLLAGLRAAGERAAGAHAHGLPGTARLSRTGEDLAVLLYTSGTSGRPKGAMLSHRALLANLEQVSAIDPAVVVPDDVVLLVLPLFHVYGLNAALGMVARQGATGVLVERFEPEQTLAALRRHAVTCVVGAPPAYVAWSLLPDVGGAFAGVRRVLSGAAPLPAEVLRRVFEVTGHHVFEGYGLTETSPVLTSTLMSDVAKPGSIGRPLPGVELRLADDDGHDVEDGDPGEIVVRGRNLFSGYWPAGEDGPDANGWFATGDLAYADADGDLHLVDRLRELVLVSGFNVYPREVEEVLIEHPGVAEAAVIGVPHPYTGESVKALVVARAGAELSEQDLFAHCARSLARFKCPTVVEIVQDLPHSAIGKVSKGRLREGPA